MIILIAVVSIIVLTKKKEKKPPNKSRSTEFDKNANTPDTNKSTNSKDEIRIKDEIHKEVTKVEWKDRSTGSGTVKLGDPVILNGVGAAVSINVDSLPTYKRTVDDQGIGYVFILHMKATSGTPVLKMKTDKGEINGLPISSTDKDWTSLSGTGTGEVLVAITEGDGVLQVATKK